MALGALAGGVFPSGAREQVHQLLLWRQTVPHGNSEAAAEARGGSGGAETEAGESHVLLGSLGALFHTGFHAGLNGFGSRQHAEGTHGSQGTPGCVVLLVFPLWFFRLFGLFGLEVRQLNAASSTWAPSTNSFFHFFAFPIFLGSLPVLLHLLLLRSKVPFL